MKGDREVDWKETSPSLAKRCNVGGTVCSKETRWERWREQLESFWSVAQVCWQEGPRTVAAVFDGSGKSEEGRKWNGNWGAFRGRNERDVCERKRLGGGGGSLDASKGSFKRVLQ